MPRQPVINPRHQLTDNTIDNKRRLLSLTKHLPLRLSIIPSGRYPKLEAQAVRHNSLRLYDHCSAPSAPDISLSIVVMSLAALSGLYSPKQASTSIPDRQACLIALSGLSLAQNRLSGGRRLQSNEVLTERLSKKFRSS
jgi:hypothetical protein